MFNKELGKWVIPGQAAPEEDEGVPPPEAKKETTKAEKTKGKGKKDKSKKRIARYTAEVGGGDQNKPGNTSEPEEPAKKPNAPAPSDKPAEIPSESRDQPQNKEELLSEAAKALQSDNAPSRPSEESGHSSEAGKKPCEEATGLAARNRELELQLDEAEQKANEAEFLLREYLEEIENEKSQYEDEAKSLFNDKAVMSVSLKAKEEEMATLRERLQATEKIVAEMTKERETYFQMLLKEDAPEQETPVKDADNLPASSEDEDKENTPAHSKKLVFAQHDSFW